MRTSSALMAGAAALLLTACQSDDGAAAPERPTGSGEPAVVVRTIPGTPSPAVLAALPEFTLYGDRSVVVPGPAEGSLLTATVRRVDDAKADRLYADAYETAHGPTPDTDAVDAGVLVATVAGPGQPRTARLPLPDDDVKAFRERLDPQRWSPDAVVAAPRPYRPTRLAVFARPWTDDSTPSRAWTLGDPTQGTDTTEGTCAILTGTRRARAEHLAAAAGPGVVWTYRGARLQLTLRPLLPHERDCDDLEP
ncbi:hypothetical protein [Streptomyces sp. VRA16 Mangrove soil]|uniref:hypothetical protein n=1 Tax=Streptomyces sp. VRA16 Mangrove soil TaxID=2817434 RepID=UPI001A9F4F43|nr:hypothetical protein [Streptomyces sp. VRA16 Mangrove soil]MBO1330130.1 hypothetical protein [Streptomyces sp. VRA16 Mangrove soil]